MCQSHNYAYSLSSSVFLMERIVITWHRMYGRGGVYVLYKHCSLEFDEMLLLTMIESVHKKLLLRWSEGEFSV